MGLVHKIFGTHSQHELKRIAPIADKVESYREEYGKLTDEQLKAKTKEFKAVLNNLNVNEKTLVVLDDDNANAALAARNLENVTVMTAKGVNVLDVINNDKLVVVQSALAQVEEVLA